jgi:hypothetical protein
LFNAFFKYDIIKERSVSEITNQKLKKHLEENRSRNSIESIINDSLKETASDLNFTFNRCDNETNKLVESKKANCIGYSSFLASLIKYKLRQTGLNNQWKVHHKVGEIYFLNGNINQYFTSKFFKDHDFVIVENIETHEVIAVDATVYDYLKIDRIRLK